MVHSLTVSELCTNPIQEKNDAEVGAITLNLVADSDGTCHITIKSNLAEVTIVVMEFQIISP